MRRTLALLTASVAVASCNNASISATAGLLAHNKNIVWVKITCDKDGVTASVDNWEARVPTSESSAVWHIAQGSHAATISIAPKDSATWPFNDAVPMVASSAGDVSASQKNGKSKGVAAGYTITATCNVPGPGNTSHKVVIDPDMIVD